MNPSSNQQSSPIQGRVGVLGATGFVGRNLCHQLQVDHQYHRPNIDQLAHESLDWLIVSAMPAVKWWANQHEEEDLENLHKLKASLRNAKTHKLILISTVDVFPDPYLVTEATDIELSRCHPYGKHRLLLEHFVQDYFDALIIRLPGLFGEGLKKNIIYDYLNDNQTEKIDTRHQFQFYDLDNVGQDLHYFAQQPWPVINLATAPISALEVQTLCTGSRQEQVTVEQPIRYDFKTQFTDSGYFYTQQDVTGQLQRFVARNQVVV